ncbi:hypothetical protein NDU88_004180 [Pleurodeles waltl]|uniref:Uncharacterized protein n=1 Tax=Pleurodeles waltl TaxID=8319 RepID=A0AAV7MT85_PLEWA|nr:hypothetical protein NDU88_004180 [Pleurodeles waltl]
MIPLLLPFGGSLLANSGPLAPRRSPSASGRAPPERDGSEPVSGRRARRAAAHGVRRRPPPTPGPAPYLFRAARENGRGPARSDKQRRQQTLRPAQGAGNT